MPIITGAEIHITGFDPHEPPPYKFIACHVCGGPVKVDRDCQMIVCERCIQEHMQYGRFLHQRIPTTST